MSVQNQRETERLQKIASRVQNESVRELELLRGRSDHMPGYDYFINLLADGVDPGALEKRTGKPALNLLCIQAPLELIHAAGFLPFKFFSGSFAAGALGSDGQLPALACPMLRAVHGIFRLDDSFKDRPWVLPTTCDWIVKLPQTVRVKAPLAFTRRFHCLELPHLKDSSASRERWLAEVFELKKFLEKTSGMKIGRKCLSDSIGVYNRAWGALTRLEERRRAGAVPFTWFLVIANSFFLDAPERWTDAVNALLKDLRDDKRGGRVFFAGSPVFFPNFKIPLLLDEAGLTVTGDDLCSSGRIFPGGIKTESASEYDMVASLAGRYHEGCLCPTFADDDRRINGILVNAENFEGVVFHVLKGCHPYDIESCLLEEQITRRGLKFLRLETDYTAEDSRNLLTRIEAFAQTL